MQKKPTYEDLEKRIRELEQALSGSKHEDSKVDKYEHFFNSFFEKHDAIMLLVEPDSGAIVDANIAARNFYGYPIEIFKQKKIQDINLLSSEEIAQKRKAAAGGKQNRFEFVHRLSSGEIRVVEVHSSPVLLNGNKLLLSIVNDITERKQAFEELKKLNERMRLAADSARFGIWDLDIREGRFEWDDWMFRLYGISRDTFSSTPEAWAASVHPDDLERCGKEIDQAVKGEKEFDTEFRVIHPNGGVRHIKAHATVTRDSGGEAVQMTGINFDITDQVKTDAALQRSEEKYRILFNRSFMGIFLHDMDGRILDVNENACMQLGYSRNELLDLNVFDLHPDTADTVNLPNSRIKELWGQWQPGRKHTYEGEHQRKDGTIFPVEVSTGAVDFGGEKNILAVIQDITERMRLEEGLRQAQKMESVGRLAGGVAHDFNNMLSVILGNTEMALEDIDSNHPLSANLMEIKGAARRSADVTRQLLAFARKQTIAPKVTDLNNAIENILKMLRRLIGEDIELLWSPGKQLWLVKMDPSQLDQILANLTVNARDAIVGEGRLVIETANITIDTSYCDNHPGFSAGDFVQLTVTDNGCGMDQEIMENLFEPFFTTKDADKGTGLGLATVYGIVKQNDGFINVYSEQDKGSSFKIYLPRHKIPGEKVHAREKAEAVLHGNEVILLVEDEVSILRMTEIILKRLGYAVLTANKPKEAIELAREYTGDIHLLLTDVVLPEMNGQDLYKKLLPIYPDLKSLFMSGYTANVIAHRGILDEGVHYIQKPFSKQGLSVQLREVLDASN